MTSMILMIGLSLTGSLPAQAGETRSVPLSQEQIVAEIQKLGGKVERDAKLPGAPIVKVSFSSSDKLKDEDLKLLQGLMRLSVLDLAWTEIGNDGVAYLRDLKQLQELDLSRTKVSDAGLVHLKHLIELRKLNLEKPCKGGYSAGKRFTDKALVHLKALRKLEWLNLDWNMLTDAGLEHFRDMPSLREVILGYQSGLSKDGKQKLMKILPAATVH